MAAASDERRTPTFAGTLLGLVFFVVIGLLAFERWADWGLVVWLGNAGQYCLDAL